MRPIEHNGKLYDLDEVVMWMDSKIMENVKEVYTPQEFIDEYLKQDPDFEGCFEARIFYEHQ